MVQERRVEKPVQLLSSRSRREPNVEKYSRLASSFGGSCRYSGLTFPECLHLQAGDGVRYHRKKANHIHTVRLDKGPFKPDRTACSRVQVFSARCLRYASTGSPPQPQFSVCTSSMTTKVASRGLLSTSSSN